MNFQGWGSRFSDLRGAIKQLGGHVGYLTLYCQNAGCTVREFTITVKPYGETIPEEACCPFCRSSTDLLFTRLLSRQEQYELRIREATETIGGYLAESNGTVNLGEVMSRTQELRGQLGLHPITGLKP